MSQISEKIRKRMVAVGITQGDLVRQSGVHRATISKILLGKTQDVRGKTLIKISKTLRCKPAELIE